MKARKPVQIVLIAMACAAGAAHAGTLRASAGVDYSSGKYGGTESVNQLYVPAAVAYRSARWGLRLTVPFVRVDGSGTIIDSAGQLIPGPDGSRSGLGDVVFATTLYDVLRFDAQRLYVDVGARVKFGTASRAEGLGTGADDYSVYADVLKDFNRLAVFTTLGYKLRGDPQATNLRDGAFASVGADYRLANGARVGVLYDYRRSALAGTEPLREMVAYLALAAAGNLSLQPYLSAGLSNSSPDWGAGVSLSWRRPVR